MTKDIFYTHSLPGRHIDIASEGRFLYFSGTAYLGISKNADFLSALTEGIQRFGSHFGGSRRSNIQFGLIDEAEAFLAGKAGVDRALTMSSGSLAGQMISHYFESKGKLLLAPGTHPALWTPANRPRSGDYGEWVSQLPVQMESNDRPVALLLNSLDPLFARSYDLEWMGDFLDNYPEITIIIDDSHGWGVMGEGGRSAWESVPLRHYSRVVVLSSLGKAYGMPGGLVTGASEVLQDIYDSPFFGGASPMSLAYFFALLQCRDLFSRELEVLRARISLMEKSSLVAKLFTHIPGHPVFYTVFEDLAAYLHKSGLLISSFRYPGPRDPLINRVVVNSLHEPEDIKLLFEILENFNQV